MAMCLTAHPPCSTFEQDLSPEKEPRCCKKLLNSVVQGPILYHVTVKITSKVHLPEHCSPVSASTGLEDTLELKEAKIKHCSKQQNA